MSAPSDQPEYRRSSAEERQRSVMIRQQRPPCPQASIERDPPAHWINSWIKGPTNPTLARRCKIYRREARRWMRALRVADGWGVAYELMLEDAVSTSTVITTSPRTATFQVSRAEMLCTPEDSTIERLAVREVARLLIAEHAGDELVDRVTAALLDARNGARLGVG